MSPRELQAVEPELGGSAPRGAYREGQQLQASPSPGFASEALQVQVETRWVQTMKGTQGLPETPPKAVSGLAGNGFLVILRAS